MANNRLYLVAEAEDDNEPAHFTLAKAFGDGWYIPYLDPREFYNELGDWLKLHDSRGGWGICTPTSLHLETDGGLTPIPPSPELIS